MSSATSKRGMLAFVAIACTAMSPARADGRRKAEVISDLHHSEWSGLGAVFDIKQSPEGYLWLTTSKGILRFDGARFQTIEEVTRGAARENEIDSVFLSSSGGLWLTTEGAGLLLWKDGQISAFPDRRCTPARKQGQLIEGRDGSLWVQATAGLFHLHGTTCEQVGGEQGYPGGFPAGMLLDRTGTLWVKPRTGPLLLLRPGASMFETSNYGSGPSSGYAYLHEAPDGDLWMSDDQGLRRVVGKPGKPAYAGSRDPTGPPFGDFTFAPNGALWAITDDGVERFDHPQVWPQSIARKVSEGKRFTPEQGLSSDAVWKVLLEREGIWVATNSGLDLLRPATLTTVHLPSAQEHEFSIAAGDHGSVWTGNSTLPLTRVSADGEITTFPQTKQTLALRRDHSGTIWSAGAGQARLWRVVGERLEPVHYPGEALDAVVFVSTDRHDEPWITTISGHTYHFSHGAWSDETDILGKKPGVVGTMADDRQGNVWFAFSNKVVKWDGADFERFSFPDGKRGVSENTMFVRGDHVWLGGPGGVQLFTQGQFFLLRWKDQDISGRVSGLVETDNGDLWLNGFSGISHVYALELSKWLNDPSYAVSADHLDELDGLPGLSEETLPEPSVVEAPDGRLWFATTKGIAWLDPETLLKNRNRVPPPVLVSAVLSNGRVYSGSSALTLPAHTENIEIDYTALSLAIPERVRFRYKLDGVDNDWQNVGTRREAYYTKLRPGHYTFRVIACNNDGVWNETGATLALAVSPAWFQTDSFVALCVAGAALLMYSLYRLRVRQVAAMINSRFQERLAERTRIAQELHDTLLQGFLSASMQVHVAKDGLPEESPAEPVLGRALQLMGQVIEEGRNAVRGLRLSHGTSLDLEQALAAIQAQHHPRSDQGKTPEFRVISSGQRRQLRPVLRDEVYGIGREALTNAFRHARANHIEVELRYSSSKFLLFVRDDGCGMQPEVLREGRENHWGLTGMRERAERIGARLRIFSSVSAGTEVELFVPGRVAFQDQHRKSWWFRKVVAEEARNTRSRLSGLQ